MNPGHSPGSGLNDDSAAIDAAAADWLARRVRGLSPDEQREFLRWLEKDRRHADALTELDETWSALDRLREPAFFAGYTAETEIGRRSRGRHKVAIFSSILAVAAAIAFALVLWRTTFPPSRAFTRTVVTRIGGLETINLPDGSVVHLNTDSAIDIGFTGIERKVRLVRGEANFVVAKDATRPFLVSAGNVGVRAVGTAFDVLLHPDSVEVLVSEGKVWLNNTGRGGPFSTLSGAKLPLLLAGERALIAVAAAAPAGPPVVVSIAPTEIERALAWQERRLEFVSTPLAEAVAAFNRYNEHKLAIADPRLNDRRFGGIFRVDGADTFVQVLESRFGIKAERSEHETVLRLAP